MHRDAIHKDGFEKHLGVTAHTSIGDVLATLVLFTQPVILEPAGDMAIPVEPSNYATIRDPDGGSDVEHTDDEDDNTEPAEHELVDDASNNSAGDGIGQANDVEPAVAVDEGGAWLKDLKWEIDEPRDIKQMNRPDFGGQPAPNIRAVPGTDDRPGGYSKLSSAIGAGDRKVPFDAVNDMLGEPLDLLVRESQRYKLQRVSVRRIEVWWMQCLVRKRSADIPATTPGVTVLDGQLCRLAGDKVIWNDVEKEVEYQALRNLVDRMPVHLEAKLGRTRPLVVLTPRTEQGVDADNDNGDGWWDDPCHKVPPPPPPPPPLRRTDRHIVCSGLDVYVNAGLLAILKTVVEDSLCRLLCHTLAARVVRVRRTGHKAAMLPQGPRRFTQHRSAHTESAARVSVRRIPRGPRRPRPRRDVDQVAHVAICRRPDAGADT